VAKIAKAHQQFADKMNECVSNEKKMREAMEDVPVTPSTSAIPASPSLLIRTDGARVENDRPTKRQKKTAKMDTEEDPEVKMSPLVPEIVSKPMSDEEAPRLPPANVSYMDVANLYWDNERHCLIPSEGDPRRVAYEIIPASNVDPKTLKLNYNSAVPTK
jgi:hypothetical protein